MPPRTTELEKKVVRLLANSDSALWFPDSARALAEAEWRRLENRFGITKVNYGTERMILKDRRAARKIALSFSVANQTAKLARETILVELLSTEITENYRKSAVEFYRFEEIFPAESNGEYSSEKEIINCLNDAFDFLRLLPSFFSTVGYLVRSIHLVKPETDDYDVSFSEPVLPFSIFVSVPRKNTVVNAVRVAEAIVHEAMHLQLTLIEKIAPLVAPGGDFYYSPWKEEFRSPQGILHALYVFRVINCFFAELSNRVLLPPEAVAHAAARRDEINRQIEMIEDFAESGELTPLGAIFARRLIKKVN